MNQTETEKPTSTPQPRETLQVSDIGEQKEISDGQTERKMELHTGNTKPIRQGDVLDQARLRPLITVRYRRLQGLICAV